jgi:hypothetical protein
MRLRSGRVWPDCSHLLQHARIGGQPQRARRIRDRLHQSSSSPSTSIPFRRRTDADPHPVSANTHVGQRDTVRKDIDDQPSERRSVDL